MDYTNPGKIVFKALILADVDSGGAYIEFPYDAGEMFATKGRVPVKAAFDGITYRGSMSNMGTGKHILIIVKDIRNQLAKQPGDFVEVSIELDSQPRILEIPEDFSSLLEDNPVSRDEFTRLSYSHQREYILWINDAKKPETRTRRMLKAAAVLAEGKKLR
ncbi:MAG: DUF1905 domain-containing protein [Dehalococcoidaceae bacterium]|nr:DUF1905 domain-containing protein [Dehalococcoidaceae bacterium]